MKVSPRKRNQLIYVGIATAAMLALVWFFFVHHRYDALHRARKAVADKQKKLQTMDDTIKRVGDTANELRDTTAELARYEADVASGDPNAWFYDLVRHFRESYKVEIVVGSQTTTEDVDLLPGFPYKQLKVSVSGTAYYHDLGNFIANFENTFPHIRLTNLQLDPSSATDEKLSFRMDIIALIKSNAP